MVINLRGKILPFGSDSLRRLKLLGWYGHWGLLHSSYIYLLSRSYIYFIVLSSSCLIHKYIYVHIIVRIVHIKRVYCFTFNCPIRVTQKNSKRVFGYLLFLLFGLRFVLACLCFTHAMRSLWWHIVFVTLAGDEMVEIGVEGRNACKSA